jgi:hypothetical protein
LIILPREETFGCGLSCSVVAFGGVGLREADGGAICAALIVGAATVAGLGSSFAATLSGAPPL